MSHEDAALRASGALKQRSAAADRTAVNDEQSPLSHLNATERKLLGPLVRRLCATNNPRFERALAETGAKATARMACVNALRIYAIALFALGVVAKLGHLGALAYPCFALAAACMAWSFWCLFTVVGPEREFKRAHTAGPGTV